MKGTLFLLCLLFFAFPRQSEGFAYDTASNTPVPFRSLADSLYLDSNQTLIALADTLYKAITQKKKAYILDNTPTWAAYQDFLDSAAKAKYSENTFRYKFLLFKSGLNKQYRRVYKDAKELNINFRRSTPVHFFIEHGIHPEYEREFCYLNLEMKRGNRDMIRIRILLLKMQEEWFFADELSLIVVKNKK